MGDDGISNEDVHLAHQTGPHAESLLREAVELAEAADNSASRDPEEHRRFQVALIRTNYVMALRRNESTEKAKAETEKLEAEVRASEEKFPNSAVAQHGREWLQRVHSE